MSKIIIQTQKELDALDKNFNGTIYIEGGTEKKPLVEFGKSWNDMAILECKVPVDKILVSKDCDGKVRTSQLEVVRELDKSEYQNY